MSKEHDNSCISFFFIYISLGLWNYHDHVCKVFAPRECIKIDLHDLMHVFANRSDYIYVEILCPLSSKESYLYITKFFEREQDHSKTIWVSSKILTSISKNSDASIVFWMVSKWDYKRFCHLLKKLLHLKTQALN